MATVWLRLLLVAAPLRASLIAPGAHTRGATVHSAVASPRRGAGPHAISMQLPAEVKAADGLLLTGDPGADAMIRAKMGVAATKLAKVEKKLRREDMGVAKGRRASEVAVGLNTREWKAEVDAVRSSSVTAVRVRQMLVQTEDLATMLLEQLRDGAKFEELAAVASTCATAVDGGEVGGPHPPPDPPPDPPRSQPGTKHAHCHAPHHQLPPLPRWAGRGWRTHTSTRRCRARRARWRSA